MAFEFTAQHSAEVEDQMRGLYQSLSEKDRRRFAAFEAQRLELNELPDDPAEGRTRRPGAGRKKRSRPNRSWSRI